MKPINVRPYGASMLALGLLLAWMPWVIPDAFAWLPKEVIEAAHAVSKGTATPYQEALAFRYNKSLNLMALAGHPRMPTKEVFNSYQKRFETKNQSIVQDAVKAAGETMKMQTPTKPSSPGGDTDVLSSSTKPAKTRQILQNYEDLVDDWMNKQKISRPKGETWGRVTDTDIMGDAWRSDPKDFKKISALQNNAYERTLAAQYEDLSRRLYKKEDVVAYRKLNHGEKPPFEVGQMKVPPTLEQHQAYGKEMKGKISHMAEESAHIRQQMTEMMERNPGFREEFNEFKRNPDVSKPRSEGFNKLAELDADHHRLNALESKYVDRLQKANTTLSEQYGKGRVIVVDSEGRVVQEGKFAKRSSDLGEQGAKRPGATAENRTTQMENLVETRAKSHGVNAMGDHLAQQAIRNRAEILGEIAAKDPSLRQQALADLAEISKDLPMSQKGEILEHLHQARKAEIVEGLHRHLGEKFDPEAAEKIAQHKANQFAQQAAERMQTAATAANESGIMVGVKDGLKEALGNIQRGDQAVAEALTGELPATASGMRRGLNAAAAKVAGGLAVVGTAYEGYTIGHGVGKTAALLVEAADTESESDRELLIDAAKQQAKETATHTLTTAGLVGATAASPVVVGGGLTGYGSYQGTRAALENTELGKKFDKAVQDAMTTVVTAVEDEARRRQGQDSVAEQEEKNLRRDQAKWIALLQSGQVEWQEGMEGLTDDQKNAVLLEMVKRIQQAGGNAALDNLGELDSVVRRAPKAEVPSGQKPSLEEAFVQNADAPAGSGGERVASLTPGSEQLAQEFAKSALPGQKRSTDPKDMLGGSAQEAEDVAVAAQKAREQQDAQNQTLSQTKRQQEAEWAQRWQQIQQQIEQVRLAEEQLAAQKLAGQQQQGQQATQNAQQGIEAAQKAQQEFARQVAEIQARIDEQKRSLDREINAAIQAKIAQGLGATAGGSAAQPGGAMAGSGGTTAINQCAYNLTWNGTAMTMDCGCPGHTFNASKGICEAQGGDVVAGGQGGLGTGLPEPMDIRTVQCNVPTSHKSGSDAPASITVPVGPNPGAVSFRYDTYSVKDQMTVLYGGQVLFDTGCVGKSGTEPLQLPGGGHVTVNVKPNCTNTKSTSWTFTLSCPISPVVQGPPTSSRGPKAP